MEDQKEKRSIAELLSEAAGSSSELVRQEMALARAEAAEKMKQVSFAIMFVIIGSLIAAGGLFYVLEALVYGIAQLLPEDYRMWLAALIVGVGAGIIGLLFLFRAFRLMSAGHITPRRTMKNIRLDTQVARGQYP